MTCFFYQRLVSLPHFPKILASDAGEHGRHEHHVPPLFLTKPKHCRELQTPTQWSFKSPSLLVVNIGNIVIQITRAHIWETHSMLDLYKYAPCDRHQIKKGRRFRFFWWIWGFWFKKTKNRLCCIHVCKSHRNKLKKKSEKVRGTTHMNTNNHSPLMQPHCRCMKASSRCRRCRHVSDDSKSPQCF